MLSIRKRGIILIILNISIITGYLSAQQLTNQIYKHDEPYYGTSSQNIQLFKARPELRGTSFSQRQLAWEQLSSNFSNQIGLKSVRLPKVPVSISNIKYLNDNLHSSFKHAKFDNAFCRIRVNQSMSKADVGGIIRYGLYAASYFLGYQLGSSVVDRESWRYYDGEFDQDGYEGEKRLYGHLTAICVWWLPALALPLNNSHEYKEQFVTNTFTTSVVELDKNKNVKNILYREKIKKSGNVNAYYLDASKIDDILKNKYPLWEKLNNLASEYNRDFEEKEISHPYNEQIKKLYFPRGEFETTIQYEERLRQEKIIEKNIKADYQQQLAIKTAEHINGKMLMLREIEKIVDDIKFEVDYEYTVSKYDADNQYFTFTIPALRESKKLIIPLASAPTFKTNFVPYYKIKHILKPTLDGKWVYLNDDVTLIDTRNGTIIPWEGTIPTYAEAPQSKIPDLSTKIKIIEPSKDGFLDAEEKVNLKVSLINSGEGDAKICQINLRQKSGPQLFYDVSKTITSILSKNQETETFQINVPENVNSGESKFVISILEEQGFEPEPLEFTVDVRAQRAPILSVFDFGISDQDKDGRLTKGESAEITVRIQNRGQGKAKDVRIKVIDNPMKHVFLAPYSEKDFNLGEIFPGEFRDVTFTILTNNRVGNSVEVALFLNEKRPRFSKKDVIKLEIDKIQNELKPLAFKGTSSQSIIAELNNLSIDIENNIPKGKKGNPNSLAVVFGIEQYKYVSDANFAHRDANFMKKYFQEVLRIPSNRIYYKTNDDVGKAEFDKAFSTDGWLDKRTKKGKSDIYVFFAGHGAPDIKRNKAYLIPYDGDPNYASQTGYEVDLLYSELSKMNAKSVTVFLDACFSGVNRNNKMLLADARPVYLEIDESYTGNVTVFSAARGKEISSVWTEKKHGLFSYYLMKGMRGDADVDKDKNITYGELGDFIEENVSITAGMLDREQTPNLSTQNENKIFIAY